MNELPWEDNLLERKLESDLKDLLKTFVAFANSVKPSHVATILIGERDDGSIVGVTDPDSIQKKIRAECDKIYPSIVWRSRVYEQSGKSCVRVEIEYSGDTPHFAGPAWIRKGSETVKASDQLFQKLVELRSSLVREFAQWIGKEVTVYGEPASVPPMRERMPLQSARIFWHRWPTAETAAKLVSVNNYWATFERLDSGNTLSEPLEKLILSYDHERNRLKVIVYY